MKKLIFIFSLIITQALSAKVDLNFTIDEDYLVAYAVVRRTSHIPEISSFSADLKKDHPVAYQRLAKVYNTTSLIDYINRTANYSIVGKLIKAGKEHPDYPVILEQTQAFLKKVKTEWQRNYKKSFKEMKSITRLNLKKKFTIYITHPRIGAGRYLGKNRIHWGTRDFFKNYSTVYLWHEILHSYIESNPIAHSIIELATDNELRKRFNGVDYPPFEGHTRLNKIRKKVYDLYWGDYLLNPSENLQQFSKRIQKALN